ncbi:efflux RND transporter permease subunit [Balneolaceae bacterium ANBcel3]|nr:efflux RND transporter permease subunit [Balneolaceae bacterium ANBcel3]
MIAFFRRKYLVSMFYLMVVVVGVVAWHQIPVEMSPDLELPGMTITYHWGRTSPEVVEREITRRVEQQVRRLRDVKDIYSITREGFASVTIYFHENAPVDYRMVEIQEYLRMLERDWPSTIHPGQITRQVPEELQELQTFLIYSISGDREPHELLVLAERMIKIPVAGISGVADIVLTGVRDPALTIDFDVAAVERLGIRVPEVMLQINNRLRRRSAGYSDEGGMRFSLSVPPGFDNLADIRAMPVKLPGSDRQITVGDFADVTIRDYPERSTMRINGNPALTIRFERESGTDAMQLAEQVIERMNEVKADLPVGIHLQIERDATLDLREELASLKRQAMISLLCVFLILLVFIQKLRAPLIILGSILFSLLSAVSVLYLIGYSINVITLAGLTIALGMVIDNAVVVFEHINPGLPLSRRARIEHVQRQLLHVWTPVIGSTLTTVGIFVPLLFALEEVRILLMPLGVALTLTLLSSVLISLTWIPYALIWLIRVPGTQVQPNETRQKKLFSDRIGTILMRFRRESTKRNKPPISTNRLWLAIFFWRRRIRWLIYPALILLIGIPLWLIPDPQTDEDEAPSRLHSLSMVYFDNRSDIDPYIGGIGYRFIRHGRFGEAWPSLPQQDHLDITVRFPVGSPFDEIDKIIRQFESLVVPVEHSVDYYESMVSETRAFGQLRVYFLDDYLWAREPFLLYGRSVFLGARTGNTVISVRGFGDPFSTGRVSGSMRYRIRLQGYSYEQLEMTAMEVRRRLKQHGRVENIDINYTPRFSRDDLYRFVLSFDDDRLLHRGLDRPSVMTLLQLDINPEFSMYGRVTFDDRQMYLIASNRHSRAYKEQFVNVPRLLGNRLFTVNNIADLVREPTMSEIRRQNQMYTRTVGFNFLGPSRLARDVTDDVLDGLPVPPGIQVSAEIGGPQFWSPSDDYGKNLVFVFLMALLSVWMIISALLERWRDPAVILLSIPLGALGIMAGTLWHDLQFDRSAMAGALLVMGIVVNNAILLMHGKQRFRLLGVYGLRSWIYVYREKMRPVLITTFTTLGGLFPLAMFGGDDYWQTLATIVIWGLSSSTLFLILMMGIWEKR